MSRLTQDQIDRRIAFLQAQLCGNVHPMTMLSINNTIEKLIMMDGSDTVSIFNDTPDPSEEGMPWCYKCESYHHPKNESCFRLMAKE